MIGFTQQGETIDLVQVRVACTAACVDDGGQHRPDAAEGEPERAGGGSHRHDVEPAAFTWNGRARVVLDEWAEDGRDDDERCCRVTVADVIASP